MRGRAMSPIYFIMPRKFAGLYESVVPIMRLSDAGAPDGLAGTGIVITPNAVITCSHIIDWRVNEMAINGPEAAAYGVSCGSLMYRAHHLQRSDLWDLCCMRFDTLPGFSPALLARATRLRSHRLAAYGFTPANLAIPADVQELEILQEVRHDGWIQSAQVGSGLPGGFSGGPLVAEHGTRWCVVGMLSLGGETAPVSDVIAISRIVSFLSKLVMGLQITDLNCATEPKGERSGGIRIKVGRDFRNNNLIARGEDVGIDVGRDLRDSDVQLGGGSLEPD